jgi:hypothetical protein
MSILTDYLRGMLHSINPYYIIKNNRKILYNSLYANCCLFVVPEIFFYFIPENHLKQIIYYIVLLLSSFIGTALHVLYSIDAIKHSDKYINTLNGHSKNLFITGIVNLIYGFAMFILCLIVNSYNGTHNTYARLSIIIDIFGIAMVMLYHSMCSFSYLFQFNKINMDERLSYYEKYWAYYMGYGTVATIIYFNLNNFVLNGIYNTYLIVLIVNSFSIKNIMYDTNPSYNKISLHFITQWCLWITHIIFYKIN